MRAPAVGHAYGKGSMLTVAEMRITKKRDFQINIHFSGQEFQTETYAVCDVEMPPKDEGENAYHIVGSAEWSAFAHVAFQALEFDFMMAYPFCGKG